jgi:hypothetical protein
MPRQRPCPRGEFIRLLGRTVPVLPRVEGTLRAEDNGKPASATSVRTDLARPFGDRLPEVYSVMASPAATPAPEELNRVGFRNSTEKRPRGSLPAATGGPIVIRMFVVTEADATSIRDTFTQAGELSATLDLRQRFPGITDNAKARECMRGVAGWQPLPPPDTPCVASPRRAVRPA